MANLELAAGETLRNKPQGVSVGDVPRVAVRPPIRCCFLLAFVERPMCGAPAAHMRLLPGSPIPRFYCGEHARSTDEAITDEALFRLVSVTLEVRMCGVSEIPGIAHSEALARLELAIAAAGGVINLHACRSQLARGEPSPPVGPQKGGRGREQ